MATNTICAELADGFDLSCQRNFAKGYHQEAVIINFNDVDQSLSVPGVSGGAGCDYTVPLTLKAGKSGVRVKLPDNGSSIKGSFAKSSSVYNQPQYLHTVQILAMGVDAATKCKLDKLDHGLFVIALQAKNGTVEIYGLQNGLSTGDYTYDITEGAGGGLIPMQSKETEQEAYLPLVYAPAEGGDAIADFDSLFAS